MGWLAKLAPFKLYIAAGGVILAVIGGMWLRMGYLSTKVEKLELDLTIAAIQYEQAVEINKENYQVTEDLANKLKECVDTNAKLQKNAAEARDAYQKTIARIKKGVDNDVNRLREVLQHETCAMVAVPRDVERVLRNGNVDGS